MSNRRQRRAQQASSVTTADNIPHTRASDDPRNKAKPAKTLLEIAAERQSQLLGDHLPAGAKIKESNVVNVTIDPTTGEVRTLDGSPLPAGLSSKVDGSGKVVVDDADGLNPGPSAPGEGEADIAPWLDTLLLSVPLTMIHFTLSVLAMHQYAQKLMFPPLITQSLFIAFPTLSLLVHFFRGHLLGISVTEEKARAAVFLLRSVVYLVVANVAGCYLLMLSNDRGYYAVMKKAPSVGTVWVWAVLEMGLVGAVGGVAGPAVYAWWKGYGL
jgi:hypothetical protein